MDTRKIEATIKELALALKNGDDEQQDFSYKLLAIALAMEAHREKTTRPLGADDFKVPVAPRPESPIERDAAMVKLNSNFFGHSPHAKPEF